MYVCMYARDKQLVGRKNGTATTFCLRMMTMAAYEHCVLRQAVCGEDDVVWKTKLSEDSHESLHCGGLHRLCGGYTTYTNI